jgi:hypothetical protein
MRGPVVAAKRLLARVSLHAPALEFCVVLPDHVAGD